MNLAKCLIISTFMVDFTEFDFLQNYYNSFEKSELGRIYAINRHTEVLKEAMNRKCMCMLRNYSSPHSKTVSDRIVEPFLFMNNGLDIRATPTRRSNSHALARWSCSTLNGLRRRSTSRCSPTSSCSAARSATP